MRRLQSSSGSPTLPTWLFTVTMEANTFYPKSAGNEAPGKAAKMLSLPPWTGSTGTTTIGFYRPSAMSLLPKTKNCMMLKMPGSLSSDSSKKDSTHPGDIHLSDSARKTQAALSRNTPGKPEVERIDKTLPHGLCSF